MDLTNDMNSSKQKMYGHIPFFCSILAGIACLSVLERSISSEQQNFQMNSSSTPISVHTSCSLRINPTQEPLKLSKMKGMPTLAFSPDSRFLAAADDSGGSGILVWNLSTQTSRNILPSAWGGQLKFSPDSKNLAIGFRSGDVLLANLVNDTSIRLSGHKRSINAISFSPDSQYIATSSADNTARIWDLKGKNLAILPGRSRTKFGDPRDRDPAVSQVSWSSIGQLLTIASGREVQIWQLPDQKLMTLRANQGRVLDAVFSPNGSMIAIASDGIVKVWNLLTRELVALVEDKAKVVLISFSPDSQKLLTASTDNTVRLWNLKGKTLAAFKGHEGSIAQTFFSSDGQCIFTSSTDGTVRIWDISGQEITRLAGSPIMSLSSDGQYLATAEDNTVLVWKLR